jgi:hypothetical protein
MADTPDPDRHLAQLRSEHLAAVFAAQQDVAAVLEYRIECLERGRPDPGEPA